MSTSILDTIIHDNREMELREKGYGEITDGVDWAFVDTRTSQALFDQMIADIEIEEWKLVNGYTDYGEDDDEQ